MVWAAAVAGLGFTLACNQKTNTPEPQQQVASSVSRETGPWHLALKVSPEHPSMAKPLIFTLHITDEQGQPVNAAEVNGVLTMKSMDMGATQVKFTPKGNGEYEASLKDMDMSGKWNLAVAAAQGSTHVKQSFEVMVND
jgi:nitrogen fixation protein FixH